MFSFYHRDIKDSKPERALSVKQNSMDYCFVAKRCEDGYRMRQHWVVKQCKKSSIYCVLLPLPSKNGLNTTFKPFFLLFQPRYVVCKFIFYSSKQASVCYPFRSVCNVSVCYSIKTLLVL